MTLYFDTSALAKLFLTEPGSERARRLWNLDTPITSSWIAFAEASAAIGAAGRAHRLSRSGVSRAQQRLDELWETMTGLLVDEPIARLAGALALRHSLRGTDAVHLACALSIPRASPIVVTADADLARAAQAEGLALAAV